MRIHCDIPLLGFCAHSGTGKTTLLTDLIPLLTGRGLHLAVVKHAHHSFDIDHPGKDSWALRKAGAEQVLVASRRRFALIREASADTREEPRLADLLPWVDTRDLDVVLVEGFKREPIPKIELHRPALGSPLIHTDDPHVIAVASDAPVVLARELPLLDLNRPDLILAFVLDWMERSAHAAAG